MPHSLRLASLMRPVASAASIAPGRSRIDLAFNEKRFSGYDLDEQFTYHALRKSRDLH
jgi:hypothetical protein